MLHREKQRMRGRLCSRHFPPRQALSAWNQAKSGCIQVPARPQTYTRPASEDASLGQWPRAKSFTQASPLSFRSRGFGQSEGAELTLCQHITKAQPVAAAPLAIGFQSGLSQHQKVDSVWWPYCCTCLFACHAKHQSDAWRPKRLLAMLPKPVDATEHLAGGWSHPRWQEGFRQLSQFPHGSLCSPK